MDMAFPTDAFFQASIKLAQPFPAPELRTRILRTRRFFWTFQTFARLLPDFLRPQGQRPRGTFFQTFWDFGPGGPERLVQLIGEFPILWSVNPRALVLSKNSLGLRSPWGATEYKKPSSLEIRKSYKITHFQFGPGNTKKIPKNYKIGQKMTIWSFFGIFFEFFWGQTGNG